MSVKSAPTLATLASTAAKKFGDQTALIFPDERTLSFVEIDRLAGSAAVFLARLGVAQGDRVVLHLPNSWQWVVAYHAILRLGAVVIPANILLTAKEVAFLAADSGAILVIAPATRRAPLADALAAESAILTMIDDQSFATLNKDDYQEPCAVSPADLCAICYTSGTTGKPKGAMLSHSNVYASAAATATIHVRTKADRVFSALPFPHVYGNIVMNCVFLTGASLIAAVKFDADEALQIIERDQVTLFEGVPTMYYQMLASPLIDHVDLSSLDRCTVGGQTMPVAKIDQVVARFGCPLLELWGMTEVAGPALSHSPYMPPRHGSIGIPFPGVDVRILDLDQSDTIAAPGQPGELAVRGNLVMQGYWKKSPDHLNNDGWFATGDIAYQDDDGYVFIVDRKKDMIITAGYNIYPAELEQVIAMHPAVTMVAVTAVPDPEKGEIPEAFVVLRSGSTVADHDLLKHCRDHLAAYKIPRKISFVSDLPKTSTGKILRRALRETVSL